jgi:hypothetical protein
MHVSLAHVHVLPMAELNARPADGRIAPKHPRPTACCSAVESSAPSKTERTRCWRSQHRWSSAARNQLGAAPGNGRTGGWSGIGCVISDPHQRVQMMARSTRRATADGQISGCRQQAGSQLRLRRGLNAVGDTTAPADDAVISNTHRYQARLRPSGADRQGMLLAAEQASSSVHERTGRHGFCHTSSAGRQSQTMQTRTGRHTARQPPEASAAVRGASRCHRCWAATAATAAYSTTRALTVFACAGSVRSRCRVTSSGGSRLAPSATPPFAGRDGVGCGGPRRPA